MEANFKSRSLFERFEAELRAGPPPRLDIRYDRLPGVIRSFGWRNIIYAHELDERDAARVVAREAVYFRALGQDVAWKVYGATSPDVLPALLVGSGFEAEAQEAVLLLDSAAWGEAAPVLPGIEIRKVADAAGLRDLANASEGRFGRSRPRQLEMLATRIFAAQPDTFGFIACCWKARGRRKARLPAQSHFASLWGGSTIPAFRHRGIYRALVTARVEEARRHGHTALFTEALATSRPILERLGFTPATSVTGWLLHGSNRSGEATQTH
ncbi:MAG: hypothetical protein ACLPYS_00860 [Vulcanimicrobiaceae bacterium]